MSDGGNIRNSGVIFFYKLFDSDDGLRYFEF